MRSIKKQKTWLVGLFLCLALCGVGCGGLEDGAPTVRRFEFVKQDDRDPRILYFLIEWLDAEGDLSGGQAVLSIQDTSQPDKNPVEVVYPLNIESGTKSGVINNMMLVISAEGNKYPSELRITLLLKDRAGHRSNSPWLRLRAD